MNMRENTVDVMYPSGKFTLLFVLFVKVAKRYRVLFVHSAKKDRLQEDLKGKLAKVIKLESRRQFISI